MIHTNLKFSVNIFIVGAFLSISMESISNEQLKTQITPNELSIQFFKKQVSNSTSVSNALNVLLDRYPHKTTEFVAVALSTFPEEYKTIINTSVKKQPMFVDEIIAVANNYDIAKPTEILKLAIAAEPSYAGLATRAACNLHPEEFNEMIKAAVRTEPDSADQIAQKLVQAFPSKTMEILITTIKEVPYVGKYVLDALLATIGKDEEKAQDVILVSIEQLANYPDALDRLVQIAEQRQIHSDNIRQKALKAGLSENTINMVIEKHYN